MATASTAEGLSPVTGAAPRSATWQLLLLRRQPVPSTAPVWVLPALALTTVALLLGLVRALERPGAPGEDGLGLSPAVLALVLVSGAMGRVVAVLVQAEAGVVLAGPSARERGRRRVVLVACLLAQVPTALRDLLLGIVGFFGLVSTDLLLQMLMSPFDPFLLWSCLAFCLAVSASGREWPPSVRVGLYVGFFGYAYALKLILVGLGTLVSGG